MKVIRKGKKKIKTNAFNVNSKTNEYFLDQDNAKEQMKDFHLSLRKVIIQCDVCHEAWPNTLHSENYNKTYTCGRCLRDKKEPKKFSFENDMIPALLPNELQNMTQCEEMLISRVFPVMQVYTNPRLYMHTVIKVT